MSHAILLRPRPWSILALLSVLVALMGIAATPGRADQSQSEDALRRRVQRFYVLSFLNRHGEMWEMFSPSLHERLGGDRKTYVKEARGIGFELYQSQVESITITDGRAVVDVRLQVRLPGATALSWRSHRMVWRLAEGAWLYAGSVDITHEKEPGNPAATDLEALPGTGMGLPDPVDLLPPPAPTLTAQAAPAVAMPAPAVAPPAPAPTERWDLVAIPPPGTTPPTEPLRPAPAAAPAPESASPTPPTPAPAPVMPAPAPPTQVASVMREEALLPPEQAAPREPSTITSRPAKASGEASASSPEESLSVTVTKAAGGSAIRRLRAIARLRGVHDPRVVPLVVAAIDGAPPDSQAVFLDKLAEFGGPEHLPIALARLTVESAVVRAAAARAVGELGSATNQPALGVLLADSYGDVRVAALTALGRLGGSPGTLIQPLLAAPGTSTEELVAAATAAGWARAPECEAALLAIVERRTPALAVAASMEALGRVATPQAIERLTALASDHSMLAGVGVLSPMRLLATRALALSGSAGSGMRLALTLNEFPDASSATDAELVAATGEADALLLLLANGRPNVRKRAAELAGRNLDAPSDRVDAIAALEAARNVEADDRTLLALQASLERLRASEISAVAK